MWIERQTLNQSVAGSIPTQVMPGLQAGSLVGRRKRGSHTLMFLSLSFPYLKANKNLFSFFFFKLSSVEVEYFPVRNSQWYLKTIRLMVEYLMRITVVGDDRFTGYLLNYIGPGCPKYWPPLTY